MKKINYEMTVDIIPGLETKKEMEQRDETF